MSDSTHQQQQRFELAREQLILLAQHCVEEGLVDSPAQGGALRFDVRSEADIDRACELAKTRLKEKTMSTNFQNRHDTPEGRNALQQIHDVAARYGAICTSAGKLSADFIAKHESAKLQQVHDLCAAGGAKCRAVGDNVFSGGDESGLGDPRELVKSHVAKRNRQVEGQKEKTRKVEAGGGHHWGR